MQDLVLPTEEEEKVVEEAAATIHHIKESGFTISAMGFTRAFTIAFDFL